jgi:hypothetical protein
MNARSKFVFGALLSVSVVSMNAASAAEETKPAQGQSGMRAFVDPETGQLVSQPVTPEQQRAVEAVDPSFRQDSEGLQVIYFADGSSMANLEGRFQQATVVEVQADKSLRTYCSDADHLKMGQHTHDEAAAPVSVHPAREER